MLETFHWFRGEGFCMIIEDLLRGPTEPRVIAEGFRLLPRLVQPLLAAPGQAVWLLPTPGFRRSAFASRGSSWEIARKTGNPTHALVGLTARMIAECRPGAASALKATDASANPAAVSQSRYSLRDSAPAMHPT
jgi:hypothetical protein